MLLAAAASAAVFMSFIGGAGIGLAASSVPLASGVVASVYDGDTLTLRSGQRVRLLQIDTPELGSGECYSRAARTALLGLMPIGSRVTLETDARLDRVDRYGRLLRYVHRGSLNVNLQLVTAGRRRSLLLWRRPREVREPSPRGGAAGEGRKARALEGLPKHAARSLRGLSRPGAAALPARRQHRRVAVIRTTRAASRESLTISTAPTSTVPCASSASTSIASTAMATAGAASRCLGA